MTDTVALIIRTLEESGKDVIRIVPEVESAVSLQNRLKRFIKLNRLPLRVVARAGGIYLQKYEPLPEEQDKATQFAKQEPYRSELPTRIAHITKEIVLKHD